MKGNLLFRDLALGESRTLGRRQISRVGSLFLEVEGLRTQKGELVILAYHAVQDPLEAYKKKVGY